MKYSILILALALSAQFVSCAPRQIPDSPDMAVPAPSGKTRTLVAYFSATGNTQAVAQRIADLRGADLFRIAPAQPYADNPYDDSDRVKDEAYKDLRPAVAVLPDKDVMAHYDTLFIGSPLWWHQPAMVVATFLDAYDWTGKVVIPFFTYGSITYLNEGMHKVYALTSAAQHIPAELPEDLDADDITTPGRADDEGIDMPGDAAGTEAWLKRLGLL